MLIFFIFLLFFRARLSGSQTSSTGPKRHTRATQFNTLFTRSRNATLDAVREVKRTCRVVPIATSRKHVKHNSPHIIGSNTENNFRTFSISHKELFLFVTVRRFSLKSWSRLLPRLGDCSGHTTFAIRRRRSELARRLNSVFRSDVAVFFIINFHYAF